MNSTEMGEGRSGGKERVISSCCEDLLYAHPKMLFKHTECRWVKNAVFSKVVRHMGSALIFVNLVLSP